MKSYSGTPVTGSLDLPSMHQTSETFPEGLGLSILKLQRDETCHSFAPRSFGSLYKRRRICKMSDVETTHVDTL